MNLTPFTKTEFKRLHKNGELLLLWAGSDTKEHYQKLIEEKLDMGVHLPDYAQNTTSYGFIDSPEHKVYHDEANNLIYVENTYKLNEDTKHSTTIYVIN